MHVISIDIETFSDIDLGKCGVYRYAESPSFDILLFSYSMDDGQIKLIDLASGEKLPEEIINALMDESIIKTAFNANFERVCLMKYLCRVLGKEVYLDPSSWRCSEVQAAMLGLPLHLEGVAQVLQLEEQKMSEGKALIRYFCMPCKPTVANGGRTRNLPSDAPEKWEQFKAYNIRDVGVELAIRKKLEKYPIPEAEHDLYVLDQKINDRGFQADMNFVMQAITCDREFSVAATEKAYELTGLENPNSVAQLKDWLAGRGVEVENLSKKNVQELVGETEGEVKEALKLRLLMAKTSVRKYEALERAVCSDGRVHGLLQFYGANRTGRWAGRLVQVQNLPQNHLEDLKLARDLVKEGRFEDIELLFGNTPGVLSELIRTAFVPKEGHRFIVADFSAIEARVISWLAGEKWRLEVFASHGKIYEAAASMMFHVPIEEVTKGSPLRQKGKISELACGYGGGVGALKAMGALEMGVEEDELQGLIDNWRTANPRIVNFWWEVDKAAITAVKERIKTRTHGIIFTYQSGMLFVTLPSGRNLVYVKPKLMPNKFGRYLYYQEPSLLCDR
jgi:DNA polymerase